MSVIRMFRVERKAVMQQWIVNFGGEDGSFTGNWNAGKAEISQQRYELMRERSTAGGGSTGKKQHEA